MTITDCAACGTVSDDHLACEECGARGCRCIVAVRSYDCPKGPSGATLCNDCAPDHVGCPMCNPQR